MFVKRFVKKKLWRYILMNELTKDYYLGLDIGTDSVGWARL